MVLIRELAGTTFDLGLSGVQCLVLGTKDAIAAIAVVLKRIAEHMICTQRSLYRKTPVVHNALAAFTLPVSTCIVQSGCLSTKYAYRSQRLLYH